MLLSDFTYINTNNRNYKKFIELGYTFDIGDRLMVKTIDLNLGSKEFVSEFNMICEIKSDYYYKLDESRNICKKVYTEKSGYNFIFIINKNYDELKKITTINDTTL